MRVARANEIPKVNSDEKTYNTYKEFRSNFENSDLDQTDFPHYVFKEYQLPGDFAGGE